MSSVRDAPEIRQADARQALAPAVAVAAAVLAVVCLVSGLFYPGFPIDAAAGAVLATLTSATVVVALGVRALASGRGRPRAVVVLALVTVVLVAGAVAARADDGRRLQVRWSASQAAFEQEVLTAGDPVRVQSSVGSDLFAHYPGPCPVRMGELSIVECRAIDGGFLFLQSQGAVTDDSGIVYLPDATSPRSTWWGTGTMTALGGPWWSWTCSC